jgi:hypothetical protein
MKFECPLKPRKEVIKGLVKQKTSSSMPPPHSKANQGDFRRFKKAEDSLKPQSLSFTRILIETLFRETWRIEALLSSEYPLK